MCLWVSRIACSHQNRTRSMESTNDRSIECGPKASRHIYICVCEQILHEETNRNSTSAAAATIYLWVSRYFTKRIRSGRANRLCKPKAHSKYGKHSWSIQWVRPKASRQENRVLLWFNRQLSENHSPFLHPTVLYLHAFSVAYVDKPNLISPRRILDHWTIIPPS